MTPTSPTILFFGTDDFSCAALQTLIDDGYSIAAVITRPDSKSGRGHKMTSSPVAQLARQYGLPVWQPVRVRDIHDDIAALQPVAGVLSSYGQIIPQSILELFTPGIINVHPSLLPLYRGPTPVETAILDGATTTGASLMHLTATMDAGPVYVSAETTIESAETAPQLEARLAQLGSTLLHAHLPDILKGSLLPTPQDEALATYSKLLSKSEALVNPAEWLAVDLERKIRAHLLFPKTKLDFRGDTVIVTQAALATEQTETTVMCRDGGSLDIVRLISPSGKDMSAADYLRGRRHS